LDFNLRVDNLPKLSDTSRFPLGPTTLKVPTQSEETMKFHKDDTVIVISGKDKGVSGKIKSVDHDNDMLIVEGVNMAHKHVKPSQKNPQGGRLHKETPIRASKVMLVCPRTGKPSRIGYRFLDDGSKERFARVSGVSLGVIAPPKARYAKARA
jgi:large subunit ribosomal protein L24